MVSCGLEAQEHRAETDQPESATIELAHLSEHVSLLDPLDDQPVIDLDVSKKLASYERLLGIGRLAWTGPSGEAVSVDFNEVLPMRRNPRLADHHVSHPIRSAQDTFNVTYCTLLGQLEQAFNGSPATIGVAIRARYAVKRQAPLQMSDGADHVAGPTFDYVAAELRR